MGVWEFGSLDDTSAMLLHVAPPFLGMFFLLSIDYSNKQGYAKIGESGKSRRFSGFFINFLRILNTLNTLITLITLITLNTPSTPSILITPYFR